MKDYLIRSSSLYRIWSDKNQRKWLRQKQDGIIKFIWVEGFLNWGIWVATAYNLIDVALDKFSIDDLFSSCVIWSCASILYGYIYWVGTKYSYKKHIQSLNEH